MLQPPENYPYCQLIDVPKNIFWTRGIVPPAAPEKRLSRITLCLFLQAGYGPTPRLASLNLAELLSVAVTVTFNLPQMQWQAKAKRLEADRG
jgi:hypothetical protein